VTYFLKSVVGITVSLAALSTEQRIFADTLAETHASTQPAAKRTADVGQFLVDTPEIVKEYEARKQFLTRVIQAAESPAEKVVAHLAMANWLSAGPTSGAAMRWLIGIETSSDREHLARNADAAIQQLKLARSLLEEEDIPESDRIRFVENAELLESFTGVLSAISLIETEKAYKKACGKSALKLSMARESDNKAVAACALLWQSFAWEQSGRPERALVSLPDALSEPEQWPYGFMCRILRCRILADAGRYTAAVALTMRMQVIYEQWLKSQTDITDMHAVRRLIVLLQFRIVQLWKNRGKGFSASELGHLERIMNRARQSLFEDDELQQIYRPKYIIPVMVEPPQVRLSATTTIPSASLSALTTQPARIPISTTMSGN